MRYRQMGKTGLYVSELCLGTMTFGSQGMWKVMGGLDQPSVDAIVGRALERGINFIDTADIYSEGASEKLLGQALKTLGVKRSDLVISTKVYGKTGPGPNDRGASRAHILDGVKASLDRLGLDYVDLYQIHGNDSVTPLEETLRALDDLVSEGLVRYIGVSNWSAWKIMKALSISDHRGWSRFASLQAYYSLAGRDLERELAPMIQDQGLGLMVWSPLAGGLLSGKFRPDAQGPEGARRSVAEFPPVDRDRAWATLDVMRKVAAARGATVAQIALAWLLSKPYVTSLIIGSRTVQQLEDNLGAGDVALAEQDIAALDAVSALPPEYPGWMFNVQGPERVPGPFEPNS